MAYNLKITEYANGQLEVVTYKQGVYTMLDGESSYRADLIDKNADALAWRFASYVIDEKTEQGRFFPRIDDREVIYNPFTEKIQRVYTVEEANAQERKNLIIWLVRFAAHVRHCICTLVNATGSILSH